MFDNIKLRNNFIGRKDFIVTLSGFFFIALSGMVLTILDEFHYI